MQRLGNLLYVKQLKKSERKNKTKHKENNEKSLNIFPRLFMGETKVIRVSPTYSFLGCGLIVKRCNVFWTKSKFMKTEKKIYEILP